MSSCLLFFPDLNTLNLSHNHLLCLPDLPPTLSSVHLLNCQLTTFQDVTLLPALTHLELSFNPLPPYSTSYLLTNMPLSTTNLMLSGLPP